MHNNEDELNAAVAEVTRMHQPGKSRAGCITTVIKCKDRSVDALDFAELIKNTVGLLQACASVVTKELPNPVPIQWVLIEAAVIGEQACFTLMGIPVKQPEKDTGPTLFDAEKPADPAPRQPEVA